jgi:hypothetical protein
MAVWDGSGTAAGTSGFFNGDPFSLEFDEEFNTAAMPSASLLLGASGTAAGTSSGTGSTIAGISGNAVAPGAGSMYGIPSVVCVPPPVETTFPKPQTFRYLEPIDRGDLAIYYSTCSGPVDPVRVVYSVFEIRPDGSLKQVGPLERIPAHGAVGEYYATGRAGECGQPGKWLIRWEAQLSFSSEPLVKEMCFRVQDAVLANSPDDITCRAVKYGWN